MAEKKTIVLVIVLIILLAIVEGALFGFLDSKPEKGIIVPDGYVEFDSMGHCYQPGVFVNASEFGKWFAFERIQGSVVVKGTHFSSLKYDLTPEEACLLGPGIEKFLSQNFLVEEYEVPGNPPIYGVKGQGWKQPLPSEVNPYHIAFVWK